MDVTENKGNIDRKDKVPFLGRTAYSFTGLVIN